jgi:hypothetical protein
MDQLGVIEMTNPNRKVSLALVTALAVGLVCFFTPATLGAEKGATVQVQGVQIVNDAVVVNLVNNDKAPATVGLSIEVRQADGSTASAQRRVTLSAGSGVSLSTLFGLPVVGVIDLGIIDEGSPI